MPSLRVDGAVRMLKDFENFRSPLFYATNQESVPEEVQTANGPFPRFTKKIFPATQNSRFEGN